MVTIAAIGIFFLAVLENNLQQEVDDALGLRASHVQRAIAAYGEGALEPGDVASGLLALAPLEEFSAPGIYVQVLGPDGAVLGSSPNLPGAQLPVAPETVRAALVREEAYATVPAGPERVRVLAKPLVSGEEVVGVVLVGESLLSFLITPGKLHRIFILASSLLNVWVLE